MKLFIDSIFKDKELIEEYKKTYYDFILIFIL